MCKVSIKLDGFRQNFEEADSPTRTIACVDANDEFHFDLKLTAKNASDKYVRPIVVINFLNDSYCLENNTLEPFNITKNLSIFVKVIN